MITLIIRIIPISLFLLFFLQTKGQQNSSFVISIDGGSVNLEEWNLDFTLGECLVGHGSFQLFNITEGFHLGTVNKSTTSSKRKKINMGTIRLFPNPITEVLFVKSEIYSIRAITIYNVKGDQIFRIDLPQPIFEHRIQIEHLTPGQYWVQFDLYDHAFVMEKIIKI